MNTGVNMLYKVNTSTSYLTQPRLWNALTDSLSLNRLSIDSKFWDTESVRAFHNKVYLIYLPVSSVFLSYTA